MKCPKCEGMKIKVYKTCQLGPLEFMRYCVCECKKKFIMFFKGTYTRVSISGKTDVVSESFVEK